MGSCTTKVEATQEIKEVANVLKEDWPINNVTEETTFSTIRSPFSQVLRYASKTRFQKLFTYCLPRVIVATSQKDENKQLIEEDMSTPARRRRLTVSGVAPKEHQYKEEAALVVDNKKTTISRRDESEQISKQKKRKNSEKYLPSVKQAEKTQNYEFPKIVVQGQLSQRMQNCFAEKRVEMIDETATSKLEALGIGYCCKKGLKPDSPNQDDFFIFKFQNWSLYGVFDGHGPFGHDISNFVQKELPKLICNEPCLLTNPKAALRNSFKQVHWNLEHSQTKHGFDCSLSGTTATVALHLPLDKKLYVANVGDSRGVLAICQKSGDVVKAIDMTIDHKPNVISEKNRIMRAGGQVRQMEGDIPHRVFLKNRQFPGLAMSRAIGDTIASQVGVISEPDILEYNLDPSRDVFLLLCSDGVWEFISSQEAVEIVSRAGKNIREAGESLAKEAWSRWIAVEQNVVDDITVEIVYLHF